MQVELARDIESDAQCKHINKRNVDENKCRAFSSSYLELVTYILTKKSIIYMYIIVK